MGLYLLWIVVGSGCICTPSRHRHRSVYNSIGYLSHEQWYLGGVLRSLHRYASDGFMLVMMLHLVREWSYGRYYGFRLYSWMTGIPLIWLAYIAAASAATGSSGTNSRRCRPPPPPNCSTGCRSSANPRRAISFRAGFAINDRFFTVLIFIHLGVPLLLILGLWAHVHRVAHVDYLPTRRVMLATAAALTLLVLFLPALSNPPADLASVPGKPAFDWFILFIHPLTDLSSPAVVWSLLFAADRTPLRLPLLPHAKAQPVAVVDPANCTGCDRCHVDCPYGGDLMAPHPDRPRLSAGARRSRPLRQLWHLRRLVPVVNPLPPPRDN
jgi:ferredoxin